MGLLGGWEWHAPHKAPVLLKYEAPCSPNKIHVQATNKESLPKLLEAPQLMTRVTTS